MVQCNDAGDKQVRMYNKYIKWINGIPAYTETESEIVPVVYSQMPLERELRYFVSQLDIPPKYSTGADGLALVKTLEESRK